MAEAKCIRRPVSVRSKRSVIKLWCRFPKRCARHSDISIPHERAISAVTISHAPESFVSPALGNLTIHKRPFSSTTLAFGLAPPNDDPGATSISIHRVCSDVSALSSRSICRLACSSSRINAQGGVASDRSLSIKSPSFENLKRRAPMRLPSYTPIR